MPVRRRARETLNERARHSNIDFGTGAQASVPVIVSERKAVQDSPCDGLSLRDRRVMSAGTCLKLGVDAL